MREKPWLIQRMKKKHEPPENPGIDGLLGMDYMGSAEYEYGALPKSLKRMCKEADNLEIFDFKELKSYEGKRFCIICTAEQYAHYVEFIPKLLNDEFRLKEMSKIKCNYTGKSSYRSDEDISDYDKMYGWWDIDFDVMMCFSKESARKILRSIKVVRDKKKEEKAEGWY